MDDHTYVFVVDPRASKVEIRAAVEEAFGVRVSSVNTLVRKGKRKRQRRASTFGKRPDTSGRSCDLSAMTVSSCSRAEEHRHGTPQAQADQPGTADFQSVSDFSEITKSTPEKTLLARCRHWVAATTTVVRPPVTAARVTSSSTAWSTSVGTRTRFRPGGAIEYDPNRNARIALLHYLDGEKRYILAPARVEVGDMLQSGPGAEIRPGNALPLRYIPVGSVITTSSCAPAAEASLPAAPA